MPKTKPTPAGHIPPFVVRVKGDLRDRVIAASDRLGLSINKFAVRALAEKCDAAEPATTSSSPEPVDGQA